MPGYSSNRSILYWSESGGAKTSQISYLARRIWREHHKRTRAISADGGSLDPVKPEIEIGLIEPFVLPPIDGKTIAIFRKLSLGWWPDMDKLKNDHKLVFKPPTPETYREFGMLAWDGITAVADRIFRDFQQSGMRLGKDDASAVVEQEVEVDVFKGPGAPAVVPKEKIYAATQSMYLFTQKEVRMLIDNSNTLPFQRTYWTALESKGEEIVGRDTIYGPMLVGSAATSKVPAWFGDCFHGELMFTPRMKDGKQVQDEKTKVPILDKSIRVYYNDHQDPKTGFKYKAKPRVPPHLYGELEKRFPGGYFDLTPAEGIDKFLDFEDELFKKTSDELNKLDFDLEKFRAELDKNRPAQVAVPSGPTPVQKPAQAAPAPTVAKPQTVAK